MKKSFYGKGYRYEGAEVFEIDAEITDILKPLFAKWVAKGYSPREISHLVTHGATDLECSTILGWEEIPK